jgi:hypothetical protein
MSPMKAKQIPEFFLGKVAFFSDAL